MFSARRRNFHPTAPQSLRPLKVGHFSHGFSLLEMLVVIGIIAVLSALALPAMQGLLGASGKRGGVNTVVNAIERARLAAIENGVSSYVAFAPITAHPEVNTRALMVFREPKEGETNRVGLTRWMQLPPGVAYGNPPSGVATNTSWADLPRLPSPTGAVSSGNMPVIRFDRFGRVPPLSQANPAIVVYEGPAQKTKETITVQRLTGRVTVAETP